MKKTFCVLGMLIACYFCYAMGRAFVLSSAEAYVLYHHDDWQATEARITSLLITTDKFYAFDLNSKAKIEFTYTVSGESYHNKKSISTRHSGASAAGELAEKLHLGDKVKWELGEKWTRKASLDPDARMTVCYHPDLPSIAFLDVDKDAAPGMARDRFFFALIYSFLFIIPASVLHRCFNALRQKKEKPSDENPFADEIPS